jgi:hypothetical protein
MPTQKIPNILQLLGIQEKLKMSFVKNLLKPSIPKYLKENKFKIFLLRVPMKLNK